MPYLPILIACLNFSKKKRKKKENFISPTMHCCSYTTLLPYCVFVPEIGLISGNSLKIKIL